ncbi:MAG TPA: hypothetical protein VGL44_14755 [Gaiellales bacterium]|jgi:hypothetical protein
MPNAPRRAQPAAPEPAAAQEPADQSPLDPLTQAWLIALGMAVVGAIVGMLFLHYRNPPSTVPIAGLGGFASLYALAQAIERLLEPVNHFLQLGGDTHADPSLRPNRAAICWGLASALAMTACGFFGFGVLHMIGDTSVSRYIDVVVTGLAVGGGTKPLHDLISGLEGWGRARKAASGGR